MLERDINTKQIFRVFIYFPLVLLLKYDNQRCNQILITMLMERSYFCVFLNRLRSTETAESCRGTVSYFLRRFVLFSKPTCNVAFIVRYRRQWYYPDLRKQIIFN